MTATSARVTSLTRRVDELDWDRSVADLDEVGAAAIGAVLTEDECRRLHAQYMRSRHRLTAVTEHLSTRPQQAAPVRDQATRRAG